MRCQSKITKTRTSNPFPGLKKSSYRSFPAPFLSPPPPSNRCASFDRSLLVDPSICLILRRGGGYRDGTRRRSLRRRRSNLCLLTSGRRRRRRHSDHRCPGRVRVGSRSPLRSFRPSPARHHGRVVGAVGSRRRYAGPTLLVVRDLVSFCGCRCVRPEKRYRFTF